MELKTKVTAEEHTQSILIKRQFDLPVELLYKAYTEAEFVEQWMGNKVIKLDNFKHGSFQFEKRDEVGNLLFGANGSIHEVVRNQTIVRTFEMENVPFPPQLEFLDFNSLSENTSELNIRIIFRTIEDRNNQLKMPFAQGLNSAHNQLELIMNKIN